MLVEFMSEKGVTFVIPAGQVLGLGPSDTGRNTVLSGAGGNELVAGDYKWHTTRVARAIQTGVPEFLPDAAS